MDITACVVHRAGQHSVAVGTDGHGQPLSIPARPTGGSAVNGGELLFLALATCYCNDLYREAARLGLTLHGVEVEVRGQFGGRGDPARGIEYRVHVDSDASAEQIDALLAETDRVAEVHNTLRAGCPVTLAGRL